MSSSRNKYHLYLALYHRRPDATDHHWALVLCPKKESAGSDDLFMFHATNSLQHGVQYAPDDRPPWRYEQRHSSSSHNRRLVARILVAKIPADQSIQDAATFMDGVLRQVPVVQGNALWDCRNWAIEALALLRAYGGGFAAIPPIAPGTELVNRIVRFAEEGTSWRLDQEHSNAVTFSEIPILDVRATQ